MDVRVHILVVLRKMKEDMAQHDILTTEEAGRYLKVSSRTLRQLAGSGAIPARKVGHEWRFSRTAIQDWVSVAPDERPKRRTSKPHGR